MLQYSSIYGVNGLSIRLNSKQNYDSKFGFYKSSSQVLTIVYRFNDNSILFTEALSQH